MARLFGLVGALALSGAQATTFTEKCNNAWDVAHDYGCFKPDYNKSVVCDGPCQGHLEGVWELCHGTDRGHQAKILVDYCQDPFSKDCSEAHEVFDFVGCMSGFSHMCGDRCKPYIEQMSMNCTSEMFTEDDGSMSNLREFSSKMLESCSDECFMQYGMFSDCMNFTDDGTIVCRPECNGYMAALQAEPCSSQTISMSCDPSANYCMTYGEITDTVEMVCHPCYMLYFDAFYMNDCGSEHGDCNHCQHLLGQMLQEPMCAGNETTPDGHSYLDLVMEFGRAVDYYCSMPPSQKCHKISKVTFEKLGALHCAEVH